MAVEGDAAEFSFACPDNDGDADGVAPRGDTETHIQRADDSYLSMTK